MSILTVQTKTGAMVKVDIPDRLLVKIGQGVEAAKVEADRLIKKVVDDLKKQEEN